MNLNVTPTTNTLVDSSHNSEGVLFTKSNGDILHIYRRDANASGDHIGNTGALYQSTFDASTQTWGTRTLFYDDSYDDRNPSGGVTDTGRFVLFFRRYNVTTSTTIDTKFLYSDDDGANWSSQTSVSSSMSVLNPYGAMVDIYDNPDSTKRYMKAFLNDSTSYHITAQFSQDGSSWGNEVTVGDYTSGHAYNISEPWFVYLGNGRILGITRDNTEASGGTYYQITSSDYGATWNTPVRTNIGAPHWMVSPLAFIHNGTVVVIGSDRRSSSSTGEYKDEGLWIYTAKSDEAFSSANYKPKLFKYRPKSTSTMVFYGYPAIAKLNGHRYLVVFTDKTADTNEDADLFQFYLDFSNDTPIVGDSGSFPLFNNLAD